jgi:hypothetical protein
MGEELSYEEEQIQLLLLEEIEKKKIDEERKLKIQQDKEYLKSLEIDENKEIKNLEAIANKEIVIEEIAIEEMRKIRLVRFSK